MRLMVWRITLTPKVYQGPTPVKLKTWLANRHRSQSKSFTGSMMARNRITSTGSAKPSKNPCPHGYTLQSSSFSP